MFDTTSTSLGIGVTGTDHPSSNLYITGNAYVSSNIAVGGVLTMGTVNVVARHDLEAVTATGNITPLTVEFTNATTGIVATGNVEVGGNVVASYLYGDGSNITGISSNLQVVTDTGNVTSNTVQFSNATTGLVTTANVEVGGDLTVSGNVTMPGYSKVSATNSANATNYTNSRYKVHKFTGNGTLTVTNPGMIEYIIVGGGGGGASRHAGAGGGGGVLHGFMFVAAGTYDIVIGAGGSPPYTTIQSPANHGPGTPGNPSTFAGLTAFGGGGGRAENTIATPYSFTQGTNVQYATSTQLATTGGNGANTSLYNYAHHHGIQGYRGGRGNGTSQNESSYVGGGGGGAGGNGAEPPQGINANSGGANGGVGRKILGLGPSDETEYFGGGGGSDLPHVNAGSPGTGGLGGGGDGGKGAATAQSGTANTGGGGGGAGFYNATSQNGVAGYGGSGTVIIRYLV
jgi:hypothetical protein